jgi:hypothetical protein
MWRRWVALWDRREPPEVLAIVRMLLAAVLLWDLLTIRHLGLIDVLFAPQEAGGLPDITDRDPIPELYRWFPRDATTARAAWAVLVGATTAFGVGFLTPLAGLVAMLVSAQLALVLPLGDRGIDMMIRNVLLLLSLSGCGRVWSVDALLFGRRTEVPSWPRHLLILQVAVVYACAGVQKTALAWTPIGSFSALYLILQDPSIARQNFAWLREVYPLTQIASASTLVFEWSAILLPLVFWYRDTRTRPGRLRALSNRVQPHRAWLLVGVLLHLGIAATMTLGIFPFAMFACYPAFLNPDELPRWLRAPVPARPSPS